MVSKSTGLDVLDLGAKVSNKKPAEKPSKARKRVSGSQGRTRPKKASELSPDASEDRVRMGRPSPFPDEWRKDRSPLPGKVPSPIMQQLREIAANEGKTAVELIVEGLDMIFRERDLPDSKKLLTLHKPRVS